MKPALGYVLAFAAGAILAALGTMALRERAVAEAREAAHARELAPSPAAVGSLSLDATRSAPERLAGSASPTLADIEQRLARLETAVAGLSGKLDANRSPGTEPSSAGSPEVAELAATVAALQDSLVRQLEADREVREQDTLSKLKQAKPEPDWPALDELVRRWRLDPVGAKQDVKLLTDAEVLRRFGTPGEVWSNEKGTHWIYGQGYDAASDSYQLEIYLRLRDGVVTQVGIDER